MALKSQSWIDEVINNGLNEARKIMVTMMNY